MTIKIINPKNKQQLTRSGDYLVDADGNQFSIINGVPRIAELDNYTTNFSLQWNKFSTTQLDRRAEGLELSYLRFFAETRWHHQDLSGKTILEVGSGAGRFSKVVLEHTKGILYSVDYSDAVTANYKNNGRTAPGRFYPYQANIYELPFLDNSFDKVFCFGVLQHTPDFDESVKALIAKAKPGGEVVVDFYPINGWWTKINAKYILRPITTRMSHERLLSIIEGNVDWLIKAYLFLYNWRLGFIARFLPVCDIKLFPNTLSASELREWIILDTFDQYSPEYDKPQRIKDVALMFERYGARVTFSGVEEYGDEGSGAVVRGVKE